MELLLYIVLVGFVFLVLALLLPVRFSLNAAVRKEGISRADIGIMLFGGVVGTGLDFVSREPRCSVFFWKWRIFGMNLSRLARMTGKKKDVDHGISSEEDDRKKASPMENIISFSKSFRDWNSVREHPLLKGFSFRKIAVIFRIDHLYVRVKLGLGDPALTGQIIGVIYAVNGILPERFLITPEWDFSRPVFSGEVDFRMTFRSYRFWEYIVRVILDQVQYRRKKRFVSKDALAAQEA